MAQVTVSADNTLLDPSNVQDLLARIDRQMEAAPELPSTPPIIRQALIGKGLTSGDVDNLHEMFEHRIRRNTWKTYRSQWLRFTHWAIDRRIVALPAEPVFVAAYLAERFMVDGARPTTLRNASAAIAYVHRVAKEENPCTDDLVAGTLGGAARMWRGERKQAAPLTEAVFDVIREVACEPRRGRGGCLESQEHAEARGRLDIAMISIMRDALLRVSEAKDLTWGDVEGRRDGSGRLLIRRSKTDVEGKGATLYLSAETMSYLDDIRGEAADGDSVIGLKANQASSRIKRAALQAGFGHCFSGHSPRIGMAIDLAREGAELPALMNAGRWTSPDMPGYYIRNEAAGRNAVARYYGYKLRAGRRRTPRNRE